MARLNLQLNDGRLGWLDIRLSPLLLEPDDPDYGFEDGVEAHVSFYPDDYDTVFSMTGTTKKWQVGQQCFRSLAWSFIRSTAFPEARWPVPVFEGDDSSRPPCTLHHSLEWMHVFLRGLPLEKRLRLGVDCFLLDPISHHFRLLKGCCSVIDAERFGQDMLKELDQFPKME